MAELAQFTPQDRQQYEQSLKYLRDLKNTEDTAREEGRQQGIEEGIERGRMQEKQDLALHLLQLGGFSDEQIANASRLPLSTIQQLREGS